MLRIIEVKYNIELSELDEMRINIDIILLDLVNLQKLSRIFMPVILINRNLKEKLKNEKEIKLFERPCIETKG